VNHPHFTHVLQCLALTTLFTIGAAAQSLIDSWQTTLPIPFLEAGQQAVSFGDHIVVVSSGSRVVYVGDVDAATGHVTRWRPTLPYPAYCPNADQLVGVRNFIIVPGWPSSCVGNLLADGSVAAWRLETGTNTSAPYGRGVTSRGDSIYAAGGAHPFEALRTVETAVLSADGHLSLWTTLNPLPIVVHDPQAEVIDGSLYVFGGEGTPPSGDTSHSRDIYRAVIRADGSIEPWTSAGFLLVARPHSGHVILGDTIHVIAGGVHGFMTSTVESAQLAQFGVTSAHRFSASLPTPLNEFATAVVRGRAYVIGGGNRAFGGGPQNTVYVSRIDDPCANDATPPRLTAPPDLIVSTGAEAQSCAVEVSDAFLGTASADDDCGEVVITRSGIPSQNQFRVGTTIITYEARDESGNTTTAAQLVRVIDDTPPTIDHGSATPSTLWPPDHKMVLVRVDYDIFENCEGAFTVLSVSGNEPSNGTGDGDTQSDWEIVDDHHVYLRAERSGSGNGRLYTIRIIVQDPSGNSATREVVVSVPVKHR